MALCVSTRSISFTFISIDFWFRLEKVSRNKLRGGKKRCQKVYLFIFSVRRFSVDRKGVGDRTFRDGFIFLSNLLLYTILGAYICGKKYARRWKKRSAREGEKDEKEAEKQIKQQTLSAIEEEQREQLHRRFSSLVCTFCNSNWTMADSQC